MTTLTALLETPERFRAWLESKPAGATVGYAGAIGSCPIACYLMESMAPRSVQAHVFPGSIRGDVTPWVVCGKGKGQPLPPWATTVARTVDARYKNAGTGVSAAEVLTILREVHL